MQELSVHVNKITEAVSSGAIDVGAPILGVTATYQIVKPAGANTTTTTPPPQPIPAAAVVAEDPFNYGLLFGILGGVLALLTIGYFFATNFFKKTPKNAKQVK